MKTYTLVFFLTTLYAQEPHPLEFFPHHQGDIFDYYVKDPFCQPCSPDSFQNVITKDSLGSNGIYFLQSTRFGKWTVDTVTYDVYNGPTLALLKFRLNADSGDSWTVYRFENGGSMRAKISKVFKSTYLGQNVTIKVIEYTDSASGLFINSLWLASKFGVIAEYGDPPGQPNYYLRGAIINGATYGIVTSVNQHMEIPVNDFNLDQNFPNPFNPHTKISWRSNKNGFVSLKIFDIVGREMKSLVSEYRHSGYHELTFDGTNLASGIYIYSLTINGNTKTKKMLLIH
ncbi:MAG: T9SS type A sorting domain-containing protein [Bacteroidetes bacterium]|nr:T9SS type A sorting domain-containing protein [Bacteroidota bacterium]